MALYADHGLMMQCKAEKRVTDCYFDEPEVKLEKEETQQSM